MTHEVPPRPEPGPAASPPSPPSPRSAPPRPPSPRPPVATGRAGSLALEGLARSPFVLLTTYRRTGEAVSTPVWVVPDPVVAGRLWVSTPAGSGKVKRLAHTAVAALAPCDRRGRTAQRAATTVAVATVLDDDASRALVRDALVAKHGGAVAVVDAVGALGALRARRAGRAPSRRVCVRLDPPA